jgi:hypothetical protein
MNNKIRVTSFDFNEMKASLREFLQSKPEFAGHNFEGSNLSMLLELLTYNTHYQAVMANLVANEMFIDTAEKRSSIVSHAKLLGYTPRSRRSATAIIDLTLTITSATAPESLVLPVGTKFVSGVDTALFNFVTTSAYTGTKVAAGPTNRYSYTFTNVTLKEGVYTSNAFTYNQVAKFLTIPNRNVDTSTLVVRVENLTNNTLETYTSAANFLQLDETSKVFFIQEAYDGYFQIYFGDGTLGYNPPDGSVVTINYVTTTGAGANGAGAANNGTNSFRVASSITTTGTNLSESVVVKSAATGGRDSENTESIRFNAVNYYGTLNRAVVADDYSNLVSANIENVKQVISWGGENNTPPKYGTVILCVIPELGSFITEDEKNAIRSFLTSKAVANTRIDFSDPEYIDIQVSTEVVYDKTLMGISVYDLESLVRATVTDYSNLNLQQFGGTFRYSELTRKIDGVYQAVRNNILSVSIKKDISPSLFVEEDITMNIANGLDSARQAATISSTGFNIEGSTDLMFIEDDRKGKLKIIYYVNNTKNVYDHEAGTVDYKTGEVYVKPLTITSYIGEYLTFSLQLAKLDVVSKHNVILRIKDQNITVKAVPDYV